MSNEEVECLGHIDSTCLFFTLEDTIYRNKWFPVPIFFLRFLYSNKALHIHGHQMYDIGFFTVASCSLQDIFVGKRCRFHQSFKLIEKTFGWHVLYISNKRSWECKKISTSLWLNLESFYIWLFPCIVSTFLW